MKDLNQRIIPAVIAAIIALVLLQWAWGFGLLIALAVCGTAMEMYRLSIRIQPAYSKAFFMTALLMSVFVIYTLLHLTFPSFFSNHALSRIAPWAALMYLLLLVCLKQKSILRSALPIIGAIYPYVGWLTLIEMAHLNHEYSWNPLLILLVSVWASDAFAYFFGSIFKGAKLAPEISPNKTISGWLGALVGIAVVVSIAAFSTDLYHWKVWLLWVPAIWFSATLGDLFESLVKRMARVKDSGFFLPGHGGFLDRLDSLIFSSPFAYFILYYFAQ